MMIYHLRRGISPRLPRLVLVGEWAMRMGRKKGLAEREWDVALCDAFTWLAMEVDASQGGQIGDGYRRGCVAKWAECKRTDL